MRSGYTLCKKKKSVVSAFRSAMRAFVVILATFTTNILGGSKRGYDTDARPLVCSMIARSPRTGSTWFAKEMHTASPCVMRWIPVAHHPDFTILHAREKEFTMLNSEITSDMIRKASKAACGLSFKNSKGRKTALTQAILESHFCNLSSYSKPLPESCPYIVTGFNTYGYIQPKDLDKCDYLRVLQLTRINLLEKSFSFISAWNSDIVPKCMNNSPEAPFLTKEQMFAIQWHQELCTNQTARHVEILKNESRLPKIILDRIKLQSWSPAAKYLSKWNHSLPMSKRRPAYKPIVFPYIPEITYEFLVCLSAHRSKDQTVGEIVTDLYLNPANLNEHGQPNFEKLPVMNKIITRPALPVKMDREQIDDIMRKLDKKFLPLSRRGLNCSHIAHMTRRNIGLPLTTATDLEMLFVDPLPSQSIVRDL